MWTLGSADSIGDFLRVVQAICRLLCVDKVVPIDERCLYYPSHDHDYDTISPVSRIKEAATKRS
jgi:hypothetical protein